MSFSFLIPSIIDINDYLSPSLQILSVRIAILWFLLKIRQLLESVMGKLLFKKNYLPLALQHEKSN